MCQAYEAEKAYLLRREREAGFCVSCGLQRVYYGPPPKTLCICPDNPAAQSNRLTLRLEALDHAFRRIT